MGCSLVEYLRELYSKAKEEVLTSKFPDHNQVMVMREDTIKYLLDNKLYGWLGIIPPPKED